MASKRSVFASIAERSNFYKLSWVWGEKYRIYHNLPYLSVFEFENLYEFSQNGTILGKITLNDIDKNRLKKTSIDYTLCDSHDRPLLCIEFDGLQKGVNVGTEYYADQSRPDPWRQTIMELKLRVAFGSAFPYFIVTYEHFADLRNIELTIVDGLIGNVIANQAKKERFAQGFDPADLGYSSTEWEALPSWDKDDLVEDWAIGVEVDCEMEHNPISQKSADLWVELIRDDPPVKSRTIQWHHAPDINDILRIQDRVSAMESALRTGATVTLHTPDFGDVSATVWLPNFKSWYYVDTSLVEDIAQILVVCKLRHLRQTRQHPPR